MTSRELVRKTLEFKNTDGVVPRDLWTLPWAHHKYGKEIEDILRDYPLDIVQIPDSHKVYAKKPISVGNVYEEGEFLDEWGVVFKNIQRGLHGEVKAPIVKAEDEDWEDLSRIHIPEELLSIDTDKINEFCAGTDQFVLSSDLVRPFERMQFLRGSENFYFDLGSENPGMLKMLNRVHAFYCQLMELWCSKTNIDGFFAMDDWGSQRSLLINPKTWVKYFKPLYKDYVTIAHKYGKKMFFHSDGFTLDIIPHLIELGYDAVNLQIFCMGIEKIAQFKGKITFWGEVDRQHLLPEGTTKDIRDAIKTVHDTLWQDGGCIAQCEFGAAAKPENVREVYASWDVLSR
ncbi:uroporphyrinogen decarboxylase [Spirochaetia bacterium]|nr:uroporphyrinogen decarboxylase [Spirochaetia bacterium]